MNLEGVTTALITPFRNDKVNEDGLRENIRFQIQSGVSAILPLGTTGETPTLTEEEQERIITIAVEEARGKVPVMVGTGSNSTAHTIENTKRALDLGADAALIVTPYYNKPTQEGLFRHYEAVTKAVKIPVLVYNIQGRTAVNINTPTLERIAKLPNIIGVKEASGNLSQITSVIERIQRRNPKFLTLSGDDSMTFPLMTLGGVGVVSVVSNLVPERIVALVNAARKGDYIAAREIHFELLPLFEVAFIETNPAPIKVAMELLGLPAGGCRLPLCELQPESREKLVAVLENMGLLRAAARGPETVVKDSPVIARSEATRQSRRPASYAT